MDAIANGEGDEGDMRSLAVAFVSTLLGLLIVWFLVRPLVSNVNDSILLLRYLVYAIMLAILYHFSDVIDEFRPLSLAALSGPSAAACAASPYLLICGIPTQWILCLVACFRLGFGMAVYWFAPQEEADDEMGRQVVAYSRTVFAMTIAILLAVFVNFAIAVEPVRESIF